MAAKAEARVTVRFVMEKETKNYVRFSEVVDETSRERIPTLYVHKAVVKELGNPESLLVSVSAL